MPTRTSRRDRDDHPTEEHWHKIATLFSVALGLDADDRAAWIASVCGEDPELRGEIESLLRAHEEGGPVTATREHPHTLLSRLLEPLDAGDRVGSWRIVRRLGAGGMGIVFLGQREDPSLPQRAAVKIVRAAGSSDDLVHRFLGERRIVAGLDHPGIARLFDAGITRDGDPWYAMEYVEGTPFDQYCDSRRLTIDQRIELFLEICDAVSHAHRNLVVHRDLKPANILVSEDGRPKLLDFGIARVLEVRDRATNEDPSDPGLTTRRWFTPHYASPEQVAGRPVATASDVYSLGVLLYRLLVGRPPYRLPEGLPDQARVICQQEPVRPSTAVVRSETGAGHSTPEELCALRSTVPSDLRRRLTGDLDMVLLKALEKDPARRYASVDGLAEDLRRHRSVRPVLARPSTFGYRSRKFVRRHRLAVTSGILIVLSLVGGLLGTIWQARRATEQASVASQERDRARLEASKSAQVSTFLTELFERADPGTSRGETVTVRDVLDRGALRVESSLADQPELQAQMMHLIGGVYSNLGLYDDARRLLGNALGIRRSLGATDPADLAATLRLLALTDRRAGAFDSAEVRYRHALELLQAGKSDRRDVAKVLGELASVLVSRRQNEEAETLLRRALELVGDDHPVDRAALVSVQASLYHDQGDLEEAERLFRETVALYTAEDGRGHPDAAAALDVLGALARFSGRLDEALRLHRRGLEMSRRLYGDEHPAVSDALQHLAGIEYELSNYAEAERLAREAEEISVRWRGAEHPETALARQELATALRALGRHDEARPLFEQTLAQQRRLYGAEHPVALLTLVQAAEGDFQAADYVAAERRFREAEAVARKIFGDGHSMVAAAQRLLGKTLTAQGRVRDALPLLRESLSTSRSLLRDDHPHTLTGELWLADALTAAGEVQEAEALYRQALRGSRSTLPAGHAGLAPALVGLGTLLARSSREAEAEPLLLEAEELLQRRLPPGHVDLERARHALASCRARLDANRTHETRPQTSGPGSSDGGAKRELSAVGGRHLETSADATHDA